MLGQDISEALARELDRLGDTLAEPLQSLGDPGVGESTTRAAAGKAAAAIRRFGDSAEFCDMEALRGLSAHVERNMLALPWLAARERITLARDPMLREWPELLAAHLREPEERAGLERLLTRFQAEDWRYPLERAEAEHLSAELRRESVEARQPEEPPTEGGADAPFTPGDVSLAFADDINPQLADTFLTEAPDRLARLSECVQRLRLPDLDTEAAGEARRLAHNVKGSANITGVRGLANFTHWVESLLEHLVRNPSSGTPELLNLLLETSDCLETMLECMVDGSPVPDQALDLMERMRAWERRLRGYDPRAIRMRPRPPAPVAAPPVSAPPDADAAMPTPSPTTPASVEDLLRTMPTGDPGPAPGEAPAEAARVRSAPPAPAAAPPAEAPVAPAAVPAEAPVAPSSSSTDAAPRELGAMVRVSVDVIDRLLGLAGELATEIVQMRGRHASALGRITVQREHGQLLQQRLTVLQELTDVRGVPAARRTLEDGSANPEFDPLELDQYNEMHSAVNAFTESLTDFGELSTGLHEDLSELDRYLLREEQISKTLNDLVVASRTVSVQSVVPRLARCVRQTCRSTEKEARLEIEGGDLYVDSDILSRIVDPLIHMVRNAIDHGIEAPEIRAAAGKDPEGAIEVQFAREGESVVVRCRDDGAGYDLERIRAIAEQRGIVDSAASLSDDDTVQLTFVPGFSTSDTVTHISGRGIGLDVVRKAVQDLRGSLDVDFEPHGGTTITLRVPLTLISMHVLLVRAYGQVFGIPSRMLHQTLFADAGDLTRDGQSRWRYEVEDVEYVLTSLDSLLGRSAPPFEPAHRQMIPLLLVQGDHEPTAVIVDEAIDSRYLVVQRLEDFVPRVRAVIGAAIMQDASVAPIIELSELIRRPALSSIYDSPLFTASQPDIETPAVLIVDDSLSARRSMSEIIEDAGYRVRTAVDGLDAIEAIEQEQPVVVLLDLEMPNMNGLELTAHLRSRDVTRDLPLLMVTSRSTAKHHDQAYAAGVDGIVTKPWQDDDLVKAVNVAIAARLSERNAGAPVPTWSPPVHEQ